MRRFLFIVFLAIIGSANVSSAQVPWRARDLGIPFEGVPGPLNSITDVKGVEVGHRLGSISGNGSGDIFIAFSTSNANAGLASRSSNVQMLANGQMDSLFEATVQATEEAVVNAMFAASTMTGINGHTVEALPHDRLREILRKYNRLK
jgi:L-aminopeptidase/D-esterase-like protein